MEGTLGYKRKQKLCVLLLVSGQNPQLWTYDFREDSEALPTLLCQVSSRAPLGHLSSPDWTLHRAHLGMPRCPDHIIIPVQCEQGLKCMHVFSPVSGVSGGSVTCILPQFSQVIAVLDLSSLLLAYYIGKKESTVCTQTHLLCSLN